MTVLEARVARRVRDLELEAELGVEEGVTALFGPSGAGKTTLLLCLAGLRRPDAGRITCEGEVLFDSDAGIDVPPERRRIGFVFQDARLFPHRSVEKNLLYGHRPGGVDPERVISVLELGALRDRRSSTLSGGEARRVALGRAILASPRLLMLDEPLTGLDAARRDAAMRLLEQVRAEFNVPMIYVSHSLTEILQLTTRVIVLDEGKVLGSGDLFEVLGTERVYRLADSLGIESLLEVEIRETDVAGQCTIAALGPHEITLPPVDRPAGTRALVAIRPEDVILARGPVEGISAQNALPGRVSRVTKLTDRMLVSVDCAGVTIRSEITARAASGLGIEPGAPATCLMKAFSFRWRRFLS